MRTCVGCRKRESALTLLRVVAGQENAESGHPVPLIPDPRRRGSGRGAWLHLDRACLAAAQRRRAFSRALRIVAAPDLSLVEQYIDALGDQHGS